MATLKELIAQREALEAQIAQTQNQERTEAIAKVRALMADHGLSLADLSTRTPKGMKETKVSKVAAKYRDKATGQTWSGRGLQPKWLKAAITSGAKLDDFKV